MTHPPFAAPAPRPAVANPALTRPDWTKAEVRDPNKLWLDKNENTDPLLAAVVRKVLETLPQEAHWTYPDSAPVYEKLAHLVGVEARNLILTPGSDGAIRAVFDAYLSPGDRVLHTAPTFAMYFVYSKMFGIEEHQVEYAASQGGPLLEADTLIKEIRRVAPKLVCLPNPDSPTGTVFSPDEMRAIIAAAGEVGAMMLVDEAYYPFHTETVMPWIGEFPHLVVARSTGKAWGMAGFRIGFAAASPEVAINLHKIRPMYEVNTIAVHALSAMIDRWDAIEASVARLQAGKRFFLDAAEEMGLRTLRGAGNFLHVAFGEHAPAVHAALDDLVYYRKDFREPGLAGFSRFSATTAERFEPVVARIRNVIHP